MRYRSQGIAYWYFAFAMILFALQVAFGLLSATKYLGPDIIIDFLPFDRSKAIHTNLLIVWVLTGFMGAAYYIVPEESRTDIHSPKLAYIQLGFWVVGGLTAIIGYFFGWTAGNKLLEQPLIVKIDIVVVMLMFLYNMGMTVKKSGRLTVTEGVLLVGLGAAALLYVPAVFESFFRNYTVGIYYRWWTVHLWVEGVWVLIQGSILAFLLIRLTGIDREVMEKWLYVIVGLALLAGFLGIAHHYFWVGLPRYWFPIGAIFSAMEPLCLLAMAIFAYYAIRNGGHRHSNKLAIHWTIGSAIYTVFGAGLLGLSHTWPSVNKWTHGTHITTMHGHAAFYGAYVMIVLAVIAYALPTMSPERQKQEKNAIGYWAFWLQIVGMFGMTMAFAAAGVAQVYLERILGVGYLETQMAIQVHYLMLVGAGTVLVLGVILYVYDFFRFPPKLESVDPENNDLEPAAA